MQDYPIPPEAVRSRLILALDVDSLEDAVAITTELQPWFGVVKVGLELFSAEGPNAIRAFQAQGFSVFADMKLHDIPTTVRKAARVFGRLGVTFLTVHAQASKEMLLAAREGLHEGFALCEDMNGEVPQLLGVTVLTSDPLENSTEVVRRAIVAKQAGCDGVICAGSDVAEVSTQVSGLSCIVPGIRLASDDPNDQQRVTTPSVAINNGASYLVIGRTVIAAPDRKGAAHAVAKEVAEASGITY